MSDEVQRSVAKHPVSGHLALKRLPPHHAVGDNGETGFLLQGDGLIRHPVFDLFELSGADSSSDDLPLRLKQLRRPDQTADYVCVEGDHGFSLVQTWSRLNH